MTYALQPHLYKNVPVYLWPWVWWQLFQIERWMKWTGRAVLGGVARDGKVYVLHWGDDPDAQRAWSPEDMRAYHTRHQGWLSAVSAVSPCGEVEFCEALRRGAPRFAKQVPRQRYALRMNRAEGSRAAMTNGHDGSHAARTNGYSCVTALSPVHVRAKPDTEPASRSVVRSTLALRKTRPQHVETPHSPR